VTTEGGSQTLLFRIAVAIATAAVLWIAYDLITEVRPSNDPNYGPLVPGFIFFLVIYAIVVPLVFVVSRTLRALPIAAFVLYVVIFVVLHTTFAYVGYSQNEFDYLGNTALVLNHTLTDAGWISLLHYILASTVIGLATGAILFFVPHTRK